MWWMLKYINTKVILLFVMEQYIDFKRIFISFREWIVVYKKKPPPLERLFQCQ